MEYIFNNDIIYFCNLVFLVMEVCIKCDIFSDLYFINDSNISYYGVLIINYVLN